MTGSRCPTAARGAARPMVMGRRGGVAHSSWPIGTTDLVGLAGQLGLALGRVPFRRPWSGEGNLPHNLAVAVTRESIRSFMGYLTALPIEEFRFVELVLDDLSGAVLAPGGPLPRRRPGGGDGRPGCPGIWYRPRRVRAGRDRALPARGRVRGDLAPHVRGVRGLAVPADRLPGLRGRPPVGPRVPLPGRTRGRRAGPGGAPGRRDRPARLFVAGDSSGGGLAASLMYSMHTHPPPAHRRGHAVLARAGPPARRAVGGDERRSGHPALEHARPPPTCTGGPPARRRCPGSTRTCPAGPRPSSPSGATRCSGTPSGSS